MRILAFRWAAAIVAVVACAAMAPPHEARASVSIAVGFDALVKNTTSVGVMTPVEQYSAWEDRRIYTFTRVRVDEGIAGDLGTGAEAWVVTRGGVVGDVGQHVDGEAVLHVGEPSLLFLRPDAKSPGLYIVTVRGQGQFILQQDEAKIRRVRLGNGIGALVPPRALPEAPSGKVAPQSVPGSKSSSATALSDGAKSVLLAHDVLPGKTLQEVSRTVATAWKRLHAP